jgi:hypothetical protein
MRFLFDSAVVRVLARVPLSCPYPLWGLSVNWAGVLARSVRASEKDQGKGEWSSPYRDRAQGSRDGCFAASHDSQTLLRRAFAKERLDFVLEGVLIHHPGV